MAQILDKVRPELSCMTGWSIRSNQGGVECRMWSVCAIKLVRNGSKTSHEPTRREPVLYCLWVTLSFFSGLWVYVSQYTRLTRSPCSASLSPCLATMWHTVSHTQDKHFCWNTLRRTLMTFKSLRSLSFFACLCYSQWLISRRCTHTQALTHHEPCRESRECSAGKQRCTDKAHIHTQAY